MKSLEKERSRRYETANGFVRDIERFLNDKAVEACPPSRSYRFQKFVRKHKGKVAAASAVLLTLVIGIIGTTWQSFRATRAERAATASEGKAIEARDQATRERDAKNDALSEKSAALTAEAAQRKLADKQRDLAERQLIVGLLRPIGYGYAPNTAELRSFVEWSAFPDSRLKLRALEVAFEDPETALRVARGAERSIQAYVGLSPTRRTKAIEFMSEKQRDMNSDPRIRVAASWLALELGSTDLQALPEALTWLANAEPRPAFSELVNFITSRLKTLSPEQITRGWDALIGVLEKTTNNTALQAVGKGLVALAPKLSPEQITRGWDALIGVLEKTTDSYALQAAGNGLVGLASKLSPDLRVRTAELFVASLDRGDGVEITEQLLELMPQLERPTQERISKEIVTILLDYLALSNVYNWQGSNPLKPAFSLGVMAMKNERSLASLLQHPATTGQPREFLLQRFEELVFHDGNHVLLPLPRADGERQGVSPPSAIPAIPESAAVTENELGGLTPSRSPAEPPPRRFHNMHDAAAWIQQNWPDFDLEATHPVTWRGEPENVGRKW